MTETYISSYGFIRTKKSRYDVFKNVEQYVNEPILKLLEKKTHGRLSFKFEMNITHEIS